MKQFMLTVPDFDANAARYMLTLMDRMTVPASEVQAFMMLRLALENMINPTQDDAPEEQG